MRLNCANCAAQYEVDDSAIPEGGREVKCSACGHVWFEEPALRAAPPLPRRPVDPDALAILREEAARETRVRSAGPPAVVEDTAPEPPEAAPGPAARPDAPLPPAAEARPEPQPSSSAAAVAAAVIAAGAAASARRNGPEARPASGAAPVEPRPAPPVPDPGLMTSTLASRPEPAPVPGRGGFGFGFLLALVTVGLLIGLYVAAPGLAEDAPAASPYLRDYVALVDAGRTWLDQTAGMLMRELRGILSGS